MNSSSSIKPQTMVNPPPDQDLLLVDVHAHLDHELFKNDLAQVLDQGQAAGLKAVITNGTNPASNEAVLALAKRFPIIKVALGLYPIDALGLAPDTDGLPHPGTPINVDHSIEYISEHKHEIAAIGEVGIDYKFDKDQHDIQKKNFEKIIALSEKIKRPMIIHSRGAEADVVAMLESSRVKSAVLHCFSGNKKLIKRAADQGLYFSIPATIVKSQHFQMLVSMVPTSQLLTETDSPWLGLVIGERNVPQNVRFSIEHIAQIKGLDMHEASMMVYKNYLDLFGTP